MHQAGNNQSALQSKYMDPLIDHSHDLHQSRDRLDQIQ